MRFAIICIFLCIGLQLQVFSSPYYYDIVTHSKFNSESIIRIHDGCADFYTLSDGGDKYSFEFGLKLLSHRYNRNEVHVSGDGKFLIVLERSNGMAVSIYDISSQSLVKTFTVTEVFGPRGAESGFHYRWRDNRLHFDGPDTFNAIGYFWIFGETDSRSCSSFQINMKTLSIESGTFTDPIYETSRNTWWTLLLGALIGCTLFVSMQLVLARIKNIKTLTRS